MEESRGELQEESGRRATASKRLDEPSRPPARRRQHTPVHAAAALHGPVEPSRPPARRRQHTPVHAAAALHGPVEPPNMAPSEPEAEPAAPGAEDAGAPMSMVDTRTDGEKIQDQHLARAKEIEEQRTPGARAGGGAEDRLQPTGSTGSSKDLLNLVSKQSRRRRRRASIEILSSDEQLAARSRWNKITTGVKMGSALTALTAQVGMERAQLNKMRRKSMKHAMKKREAGPTCRNCVLHPRSLFRQRWDTLLFAMLMYCAFVVPFRLGFDVTAKGFMLVWESLVDVWFLFDVVLNFRTGYLLDEENEDSRVEMMPIPIAKGYLKSWFLVDAVSAFPVQLVSLATSSDASDNASVSKLPRCAPF
jgi:hypothetical protein